VVTRTALRLDGRPRSQRTRPLVAGILRPSPGSHAKDLMLTQPGTSIRQGRVADKGDSGMAAASK
jgi:hypothetical protein